ncbi:MAG: AraC family transcriptional regulator [Ignavibacteria bacterium]|nr:AraC family transcriptional regulator [Ignavibacteria bacterium]
MAGVIKEPLQETRDYYNNRLHAAIRYIENNLAEPIQLDDLAACSCISKYHFHRLFHAFTGETPAGYIQRLRLEKAAQDILLRPHTTVQSIGFDNGFTAPEIFSRAFRQYFGISPSRYRKNSKNHQVFPPKKADFGTVDSIKNSYTVEVRFFQGCRVAAVTSATGYNKSVGEAFSILMHWAGKNGFVGPETRCLGIPLDNPDITNSERCRYKACVPVPGIANAEGPIEIFEIPAMQYAVLSYNGPESGISEAYSYLYGTYLLESNVIPADSCRFEYYYQSPESTPDRHFVMDIFIPIEKIER